MDESVGKYEIKPYIMTDWEDHIVDPLDGEVLQQGTPVSARNMNKIERGIHDAYQFLMMMFGEIAFMYPIDTVIQHDLNAYPDVYCILADYGCGHGPCGMTPCGGTIGKKMRCTVEYLDGCRIQLSVEKSFGSVQSVTRSNQNEYIITFIDSTLSLYVLLHSKSGDAPHNSTPDNAGSIEYLNPKQPEINSVSDALDCMIDSITINRI